VTGDEIQHVREAYGMSMRQLAQLLGVNVVTISRWEGHGPAASKSEGVQAGILRLMHGSVSQPRYCADIGKKVTEAMLVRGNLYGLWLLLGDLLGEDL
jgi:transcriptional regulator with XRE-family HTH domain